MGTALRFVFTGICIALAGCSALIDPDTSRLGGDGGGPDRDAGHGEADAGHVDTDAGHMCPPSCDDSVDCTADSCQGSSCVHLPDDGMCADGERCSPVLGCVSEVCTRDEECDDGAFCNGVERCVAGGPGTGCVGGDPIACPEDRVDCSTAFCDEDADACGFMLDDSACADGVDCTVDACDPTSGNDGCTNEADDSLCASTDFCTSGSTCDATLGCSGGTRRPCDDANLCTVDACSDALMMCVNTVRDDDMDDHHPISVNGPGGPAMPCGGDDCNDADPMVHPGATERCNRVDDNCNGVTDEGCAVTNPGDDCTMPTLISLVATTSATVTGSFSTFTDSYQTNTYCGAETGGHDAVYMVELPLGLYDVTIDTIGSTADTVIAVGFTCDATAFDGVCNDDIDSSLSPANRASRIWAHRFGSNTGRARLYVLVDAFDAMDMRAFTLNVRRSAAAPDMCPTGAGGAIPLDISGGGAVVGFNTSMFSAQSGTCSPAVDLSSEAILRFRRPTAGNVNFEVFSLDSMPLVYIRQSPCATGTQNGCQTSSDVGGGLYGAVLRRSVTTELQYLFVDGGPATYAVYYEPF